MCTILRTYINSSSEVDDEEEEKKEPPDSLHMINIFGALGNLSNLLHEALHAKVNLRYLLRSRKLDRCRRKFYVVFWT